MQQIEDFYSSKGYSGAGLRAVLLRDKDYTKLLRERKQKVRKKATPTKSEIKKYVLSTEKDYTILKKIKELEKEKLNKQEKHLIKLIKSQLEYDWRKPLIKELNRISQRHAKN